MTLNDLKTLNLIRLCKEHGIGEKEGKKLGDLLGTSRQHGSQLLKGTSKVGNETILRLCEIWKIDIDEFIKPLPGSPRAVSLSPPDAYIQSLETQIALLRDHVNTLSNNLSQAIAERKTDIDRIDKRHLETVARIDDSLDRLDNQLGETQSNLQQVTAALIQAEKQKDFLPLRILAGGS